MTSGDRRYLGSSMRLAGAGKSRRWAFARFVTDFIGHYVGIHDWLPQIKLALKMLKDESLVHYEASFCYDAFQFCVLVSSCLPAPWLPCLQRACADVVRQVSDFTNAKAWIRRAWEVSVYTSGPVSNAARMFKMYWANPRSHQLAGTLPHTTLSGPDPQ